MVSTQHFPWVVHAQQPDADILCWPRNGVDDADNQQQNYKLHLDGFLE